MGQMFSPSLGEKIKFFRPLKGKSPQKGSLLFIGVADGARTHDNRN
jgi:hypothetical protein